jgi:hypothetical protein
MKQENVGLGLGVKLERLDLLTEDFVQDNIVAKAKIYDFLPVAYNSELLVSKIRQQFTDSKLRA